MQNHTLNRLFNYIIDYKRQNDGNSPTMREMCDDLDLGSTSYVSYLLDRLAAHGKIEARDAGHSRSIRVVGGQWTWIQPNQ